MMFTKFSASESSVFFTGTSSRSLGGPIGDSIEDVLKLADVF